MAQNLHILYEELLELRRELDMTRDRFERLRESAAGDQRTLAELEEIEVKMNEMNQKIEEIGQRLNPH